MSLRDHARGKWPQIIAEVVGEDYADTRKHRPCPKGDGTDCYRFSGVSETGKFFCKCSPDGKRDGFDLIQCARGVDFAGAARLVEGVIGKPDEPAKPKPEHWSFRFAREARPSSRSRYLENRGLSTAPGLLFHRAFPYFDEGRELGRYPAMVAPMKRQGRVVGHHVTYLRGGAKAGVPAPRKVLAAGSTQGACVELYPKAERMGVAEGIETAIAAAALFRMPVWACLNTSLLKQWDAPEGVREVTIYADHDENFAGHAAAYGLAHRLAKIGIAVSVHMPPEPGDWNDVLLARSEAA